MTPERWSEIERIYHQALELGPEQRAAFVAEACSGDEGEAVRREVESLLQFDAPAQRFLRPSALGAAAQTLATNRRGLIGVTVSHYHIHRKLGSGGMGVVYEAEDTKLRRAVALKFLPEDLARDARAFDRLRREAQAASALNHPNVCTVYDIDEFEGQPFIAMELLQGQTLSHRISGRPLPVAEILSLATQLADALAAAHAQSIVHRDIKPQNIFVTPRGKVKVLDFGIAKQSRPAPEGTTLTDTGSVVGTAGYMAPEQIRAGIASPRSDLFSFGVVLYEMLGGKPAFGGSSSVEVMHAILKDDPPTLPDSVPALLDRIVRRCLEKDPERRFQTASDLVFALESVSGDPGHKTVATPTQPAQRWLRMAAVAMCACGAYIAGRSFSTAPSFSYQRLTFRRGAISAGRFANGGRTVVYSANWDGNGYRVYSTQPEGPESRDLGIANTQLLAISRSGEMALRRENGTLARAPVSGGSPRDIAENIESADWSPDGSELAVVRAVNGMQRLEFPIGKALYQTTGFMRDVRVSPRADLVAFFDHPVGFSGAAYLTTVDRNGHTRKLTDLWMGITFGLVWSPAGDEIFFAAAPSTLTTSLYAISRSGHRRLITHFPGCFRLYDVTLDGRLLVKRTIFTASMIYQASRESKEADLYWHDYSDIRDISRDGRTLLFAEGADAARNAAAYAYIRGTNGSPAIRLGAADPLALSPDGKWAAVLESERPPAQVVLLPTGPGEAVRLTHDNIHHQGAAWTPDGKLMVVAGNEPGHNTRYYLQALDGSPARAITPENVAYDPTDPIVVSPDNKAVAINASDGTILLQPLDAGQPSQIPNLTEKRLPLRWCPDNYTLLVLKERHIPVTILKVDIRTGSESLWTRRLHADRAGLDGLLETRIGADCQSVAYTTMHNPADLWLVDGLR
ncbi:MAG TPA: protein kinase [Bryobacteraceae bacterium]|jgi:serine/threonine protein kinase/Tol biopolymer transport system component|nr:protein kinase [Bryobacteraceae bacterium]